LINPDAPADKPETEQMVVIHQALRREFALLPALVAAVPDNDAVRARTTGDHLTLVLGMLHDHHEAEDELLWPLLRQRVPLRKKLIDVMEQQHQAVADAIHAIQAALPAWSAHGSAADRDRIAAVLRRLDAALTEHLGLEEQEILPLIHEHVTVPEWLAPQHHAVEHGPKSFSGKLTIAGLVLEDATPPQRAWFMSMLPPPARLLWRLVGARRYAAHVREVRTVAGH
jgi:iron-sulfur cluster repair protein YtfE (RIC family)